MHVKIMHKVLSSLILTVCRLITQAYVLTKAKNYLKLNLYWN